MANLDTEYLTTRELADLLRIKERKVYDLVASGEIPCSRATGKLLFSRRAVDDWLASKSSGPGGRSNARERPSIVAGSHDPLLEWALLESQSGLASFLDGSLDGLDRFAAGDAAATGLHLHDSESGDWNTAAVSHRFGDQPVVLMEFAWRQRGLILSRDLKDRVTTIADLRGHRIVPRQPTAGSQALLLEMMDRSGVNPDDVEYADPVRTESAIALTIRDGKADAGFGLLALAHQHRLGFHAVIRERFDLLIDRHAWFEPSLQRFAAFCRSPVFAEKAEELKGYDVSGFGRVHFNGRV